MVGRGAAVAILDDDMVLLGYQLTVSDRTSPRAKPTFAVSDAVLTHEEINAIIGQHFKGGENIHGIDGGPAGRSRTAGLNERGRKLREMVGLETVDFVEAACIKLEAFNPANGRGRVSYSEGAVPA
jgi:hypothetical protein